MFLTSFSDVESGHSDALTARHAIRSRTRYISSRPDRRAVLAEQTICVVIRAAAEREAEPWRATPTIVVVVMGLNDAEAILTILTNDRWNDAWGSELVAVFNGTDNSTLIVSPGVDKQQDTGDDIQCLHTFRGGWENGRRVWHHNRNWKLPEGLGAAVEPHFDKDDDQIEYTQAVRP